MSSSDSSSSQPKPQSPSSSAASAENSVTHEAPKKSGFNISAWALQHKPLTRYLMVVFLLLGVFAYLNLGQDEDPPFTFRAMVIRSYWPGATARQVADQVADKIERALQEVPYVDKVRSYTKPGESLTFLLLKDSSPPKEVNNIWYQARKKVTDIQQTLPPGVYGPYFNDDFGDVYGSIYALSADGFTPEQLRQFAEQVRSAFLNIPNVAKVELFGVQEEKIYIEIPPARVAELGLDFNQIINQLNAQNAIEGQGEVTVSQTNLPLRVSGAFNSIEQLRAMPIRATNPKTGVAHTIQLGDIAHIYRDYIDPPRTKVRFQGNDVIAIGISMSKGGDIIELGKNLQDLSQKIQHDLPVGVELAQIQDQPAAVSHSVGEFIKSLVEAVVIVLAVSFLTLGLHTKPLRADPWPGLVVAITIPLVLAITFITMYYWGVGLHKISLGALIIALGLLVDDAIIAVEMMVRKLEEGYDKTRAATFAYEVTAMPMLTGTLITATGFLPIGMAKSTVGEYTYAIFAVTMASLLISWVVSVYFVPYLGSWLLRTHPKGDNQAPNGSHELFDTPFYSAFRKLVNQCVTHRWIAIGAAILAVILGIYGMKYVEKQFFPDSSRPEMLVDIWLPEGSSFGATETLAKKIEARLLKEPDISTITTWVGSGAPRFYLPLDQILPQTNVSQMIVLPQSSQAREELRQRLPVLLAEEFPQARTRIKLLPNGPPVPYPVQFRVIGHDPEQVRYWADEALALMRKDPTMTGVNDNWNESIKAIRLKVDQDKARALGVTSQSLAAATRTAQSGSTIGQYREGDRLIDIVFRSPASEREALNDIQHIQVATSSGRMVPLTQIAQIKLVWEPGVLWREGRHYAVTVQGDVKDGVQGTTVSQRLWPQMQQLQEKMPAGYSIELAGTAEESSKGQGSIFANLPIALFIIFTLLMLQLQSFSRSILAFLTGFMGIFGVTVALLISHRPLGFVAFLGVIALIGMIIRNAVILIDQIEAERSRGVPVWDAIVESAVRRFRPIVLTAAAAVLAMIPLSRSVFWGPMAIAIMGGLVVATALTLLILPAMYAAWFKVKKQPLHA